MSNTCSKRTILMQENFIKLHNEGYSIPEIAKKYELTPSSVYKNLQKIADKEGVKRQSLLNIVHKQHVTLKKGNQRNQKKTSGAEFFKIIKKTKEKSKDLIVKINERLS